MVVTCHDLIAVRSALGEELHCPVSFTGLSSCNVDSERSLVAEPMWWFAFHARLATMPRRACFPHNQASPKLEG